MKLVNGFGEKGIVKINANNALDDKEKYREMWFRFRENEWNEKHGRIIFVPFSKYDYAQASNLEIQEDTNKLIECVDTLSNDLLNNSESENDKDYLMLPIEFLNKDYCNICNSKEILHIVTEFFNKVLKDRYLFSEEYNKIYHIHDIFLNDNKHILCKCSWLESNYDSIGYAFNDTIELYKVISKDKCILYNSYYNTSDYFNLLNKIIELKKKVFKD